ncbi:MAG: replicative DNA helicase [Acidobacteria bacterium]|nr:replicative DNA helicase [Acidobacteriota bacterium]MCZ6877321.1 replicative DNA helicase [Acidobacteriota bacterium]
MPADLTIEKSLPHSPEAERAVLGAILLENTLFDQTSEMLTREDFYLENHRNIFSTMERLSSDTRAIDLLTLREELQKQNELEAVGGVAYVASLLDGVPRVSSVMHYARIVKEKSLLRKLIHSANEILVRGFSNEEDPLELLERAEKSIFNISQENIQGGFVQLQDLLTESYANIESLYERKELISGIPTGFHQLDQLTSGLRPSEMIVVAARPGLGKTSLVVNIAQTAASEHQKVVGIFSLEMSAQQLVTRMLCSEARVDSHKMRSGYLSKDDWKRLAKTMSKLARAQIFIDDSAGISVVEMRSKARRLKAEHGLDLLIVDYLQLMSGTSSSSRVRFENRQQEISTISRSLKGLAKELNIPLIAVSQLSRAPEQRKGDHRPQLSDLRESGSIEQDADLVLFLYREDLYKKEEDPDEEGIVQLIIGKQRNGPTGVIKLAFIAQWTKFENLARDLE